MAEGVLAHVAESRGVHLEIDSEDEDYEYEIVYEDEDGEEYDGDGLNGERYDVDAPEARDRGDDANAGGVEGSESASEVTQPTATE